MTVWELMRPSWCPSPNADTILRATQDVQRELNADYNLRDLNITYNVMITASKSNGEDKVELPGWGPEDWVKPGSCLAEDGARYLVGSTLAPMCRSRYPVHFVAVDVKSTRTIVDQAFSVPK